MKFAIACAVAVLVAGFAPQARAFNLTNAWYGGDVANAGPTRYVEFLVRDGGVRAWVRDQDDRPVKAGGRAVLTVGERIMEVPLAAKGDALAGEAAIRAADKVSARLVLSVEGEPVTVQFQQPALALPSLLSPLAQSGKQAFEAVCATCHGTALRGSDKAPPLLHLYYTPGWGHGDDSILEAATQGVKSHMWRFGDMPKPAGLKPGQETEILAYVRAMQGANGLDCSAPGPASSSAPHIHSQLHGSPAATAGR